MAGTWGSAPRADSGLVGITEAAAILGVTTDLLRSRTKEGRIPCQLSAGGHRRYQRADIVALIGTGAVSRRPPGVRPARVVGEPLRLSAEDEQECRRIAEAAATLWTRKVTALEWDDAMSDAMFGIAVALTRLPPNIPWQASCWTHAQWQILRGIRKRSGISSRAYDAGVRHEALPVHRQRPVSLEAALELTGGAPDQRAADEYARALNRVFLEDAVARLDPVYRVPLINGAAHEFTDAEIAAEMGTRPEDVAYLRKQGAQAVRNSLRSV